jgi:hypothetical protein
MKVAIIYTGAVRTMEKVIQIFKKNVLIDEHRHVFAVIQSSQQSHDLNILNQYMDKHLKHVEFFNQHDQEWLKLKSHLLSRMNISAQWKHYLGEGSGSMIEYYQMYLAYLKLEQYEIQHQIKYNYIIRIRTDCVIAKPLHFDIYQEDYIKLMIQRIQEEQHCDLKMAVTIFMSSLLDQSRTHLFLDVKRACYSASMAYDDLFQIDNYNLFIKQFVDYMNQGNYLITFRDNVVYYGKRHVFNHIFKLGIIYGKLKNYDDGYWFNAECQLKSICLFNDIDVFNSYTSLEEKSLYEFNNQNYYDDDQQLKIRDDLFFFLQRC